METLFIKLLEVLMIALIISIFAQQVIEGILNTFKIESILPIKFTVIVIESWLVYYVAYFMMTIVEWQHLITILILVFAGAEVINAIIKKFKDIKTNTTGE